jgi:hypothetical protein
VSLLFFWILTPNGIADVYERAGKIVYVTNQQIHRPENLKSHTDKFIAMRISNIRLEEEFRLRMPENGVLKALI